MAAGEEKSSDFYAVLGLKKDCTPAELRNAYKKLAMKWHPDRCSASANEKYVEESKKKISRYSTSLFWMLLLLVLSDANKRFLYDVGIYNSDDDDDENGMGDFLNEMVEMMNQNKPNENSNESFADLQQLFEDIFHTETDTCASSSRSTTSHTCVSSQDSCSEISSASNKRNSSEMSSREFTSEESIFEGFCIGEEHQEHVRRAAGEGKPRKGGGSRRRGRQQKISSWSISAWYS